MDTRKRVIEKHSLITFKVLYINVGLACINRNFKPNLLIHIKNKSKNGHDIHIFVFWK